MKRLALLAGIALAASPAWAVTAPRQAVVPAPAAVQPEAPPSRPTLRSEVTVSRDLVLFGDIIAGLTAQAAGTAAFRAPALGETGTIQANRIVDAARQAGLLAEGAEIDRQGAAQVVVTRAARKLGAAEIEAAIKAGLASRYGIDAAQFALTVDGGVQPLAVEPELTGELAVGELHYDPRSRRLQAQLALPGSVAMRLKPLRVTGQMVETVAVVVPKRAIARGETLQAGDVALERRPRDSQQGDGLDDLRAAIDKVARRALPAGLPLKAGDVQREEIVGRGDIITIVYETPGLLITLRGRANEAGAMGDVIAITNPQSKRTLQGTVTGPGRVAVKASQPGGRVASVR